MVFSLRLAVVFSLVGCVAPHGRLLVPPQRSSMWREGFPVPTNYNDNGLNCGGFGTQFDKYGGKCGVCGDEYGGIHHNQIGGKYATGIIGRTYKQGDIINVKVELTANHLGYFEFRLCPDDVKKGVTHECLDKHLLTIVTENGGTTRYYPGSAVGMHLMKVRLPAAVTCPQCVFQWKYRAGNSYGCDTREGCCIGCGNQEHFINCADIAITLDGAPETRPPQPQTPTPETKAPVTSKPWDPVTEAPITKSPSTGNTNCRAAGAWEGQPDMTKWCKVNCASGYCPSTHCNCSKAKGGDDPFEKCRAAGPWAGQLFMTKWCKVNCAAGDCPSMQCTCN